MEKITQRINQANIARINEGLRGFPKVEPTKVFDDAFNRPISEWERSKKKTGHLLIELAWVWKRGFMNIREILN